jgi:hypothetical protein
MMIAKGLGCVEEAKPAHLNTAAVVNQPVLPGPWCLCSFCGMCSKCCCSCEDSAGRSPLWRALHPSQSLSLEV